MIVGIVLLSNGAAWTQEDEYRDRPPTRTVALVSAWGLHKPDASAGVKLLSVSPDGRLALWSSDSKPLGLWDVESGKQVRNLERAPEFASFSRDGKWVMVDFYHELRFWDLATGVENEALRLKVLETTGTGQLLPGGREVAFFDGLSRGEIDVVDLRTGRKVRTLKVGGHRPSCVAASMDGTYLFSGGCGDRKIRVWDLKEGTLYRTLAGHTHNVWSLALSADGKTLISGAEDATIRIWDVAQGKELRTLEDNARNVKALAISPDGRTLLSGDWRNVRIWSTKSWQEVDSFPLVNEDAVNRLAWMPDGKSFLVGTMRGYVLRLKLLDTFAAELAKTDRATSSLPPGFEHVRKGQVYVTNLGKDLTTYLTILEITKTTLRYATSHRMGNRTESGEEKEIPLPAPPQAKGRLLREETLTVSGIDFPCKVYEEESGTRVWHSTLYPFTIRTEMGRSDESSLLRLAEIRTK